MPRRLLNHGTREGADRPPPGSRRLVQQPDGAPEASADTPPPPARGRRRRHPDAVGSGWGGRPVLRLLAAAGSGLAVAAAFPPYDVTWLLPVGLAGLMVVTRGCGGKAGFGYGLAFGFGFMVLLMRWLTIIGPDAWLVLSLLEGCFYGLMGLGWVWTRRYVWWPVSAALLWVGAELLRGTVPFGGLPWGRLAFGLVDTTFVRYGRIGGTALVSFLAVLVVALVVDAVERRRRRLHSLLAVATAVGVVALGWALPVGAAGPGRSVTVAAIQGNVPGEGLDPFAQRRAVLNNHARATYLLAARVAAGEAPQPDIVIWPENSTDIDPFADASAYAEIDRAVRAIGVPTLVGAVVAGPDPDHVQNMGIVWSPVTGAGAHYVKRHPVPFGEYIPFRGVLTKLIKRLQQIPRDFAAGTRPGVLHLGPVRIGDVICFEVAYDGLIRDVVNGGAQLLVVQTNNATYVGTGQLQQQFAISRYRAIEAGRSVVVAATDGISGIVAPDGTVLAASKVKTRAILERRVTLAGGVTSGVRWGAWLDVLLSLAGLVLAVGGYLGNRRRVGRMGT